MNTVIMIIISLIAGILSTMNVWVDDLSDTRFHLNDVYMVVLMTSWMILLMSIYNSMFDLYQNNSTYIFISGIFVIVLIYLIRTQNKIDDKQFLKGMIPHHS